MPTWTIYEAIALCTAIEQAAPSAGCHVALTGGVFYKFGPRKDLDLVFYRIRQVEKINEELLFSSLEALGIHKVSGFGFCVKCEWKGKIIDALFPEEIKGHYQEP